LSVSEFDRAFYFYNGIGDNNGKFATDLTQFSEALKTVDIRSINFHLYREDFEKWLRFIGEQELAAEVSRLRRRVPKGERCRKQLCAKVEARLKG